MSSILLRLELLLDSVILNNKFDIIEIRVFNCMKTWEETFHLQAITAQHVGEHAIVQKCQSLGGTDCYL